MKKSVVFRSRPLAFDAFGSFVAKRMPIAGRASLSESRRIFVAMTASSTLWELSPTGTDAASGAKGLR